jgi:hypothetical protein
MKAENTKFQAPSSRETSNSKHQRSFDDGRHWGFGVWSLFGIWCLEFGV